ncbi:MAG: tetratricopeptide repeat protein [Betaproteobacteria bacterium]|nr:tetratricopeptide repeat protein [Betaproteobacteria bacterium]
MEKIPRLRVLVVLLVAINTGFLASAGAEERSQALSHGAVQGKEAMAALLRQADVLIRAGKQADAYKLLEPKEDDYSGELAFDYMLGITALDSGQPDRATIAFERVLTTDPNFAGARLDMARAYLAMGSDDLAKNEFEIVLTQSPPDNVKSVVQKYLGVIAERRLAKIQRVTGYLESSVTADSNVTAVTSDFTTGVQDAYGIPGVLPTGSSVLSSGMTAGVAAGVDFSRVLSEEKGISVFAGADVRERAYKGFSSLNSSNLDLRGGLGLENGDNTYRLFANFGQYRQAGMSAGLNANRNTPGLGAEWKRKFGERDQFTLTTQYSRPRYPAQNTQDTNQVSLSASWLHVFEGKAAPLVFASVNRSADHALRPLASGSDMSRTTTGLRGYYQMTPRPQVDVFLSAGVSRRDDDSLNARSALTPPVYGRDLTKDVSFGANWRPWPKWTLKGQFAAFRNDSNLTLYQYRRNESSISARYDF